MNCSYSYYGNKVKHKYTKEDVSILIYYFIFIQILILSYMAKSKKNYKGGKWSLKYKRSIDCKHPKGFSQKQHCKYGRKKTRRFRHFSL